MPHHRPANHPARQSGERVGLEPVAVQQISPRAARYGGEPQRARSGIGGHREGPGKVRQRVARRAPQPHRDVQDDCGNPQARQGCLERPVTEHRDRPLDSERREAAAQQQQAVLRAPDTAAVGHEEDAADPVHGCPAASANSRRASAAIASQVNRSSTRRRPASPKRRARVASCSTETIASAAAPVSSGSTRMPVSPSETESTSPPDRPATTGLPQAAASRETMPNPSAPPSEADSRLSSTRTSEERYRSVRSSSATSPTNTTSRSTPTLRATRVR